MMVVGASYFMKESLLPDDRVPFILRDSHPMKNIQQSCRFKGFVALSLPYFLSQFVE